MSKVIFITGASSGLGKAIGQHLHQEGFKVFGTSRTPSNYPNFPFPLLEVDVRSPSSIQSALELVLKDSGRIDVVINNAGVGITGPIEETLTSEIKNNFETNFFGPIEVIKAALPHMRNQKSGLIINVTSIAGSMGLPFRGVYSSSKGALALLTEALRIEVKPFGIDIVNLAPGDYATNIASNRYHAPLEKDSPYFLTYQKVLNQMNEHVELGNDPKEISEAVFKIIQTLNPCVHYRVGSFMQKFSVILKGIIPARFYEKILRKHYNLD
jgi:NAD(P)-dependent dehydrogenase (short-subunit alcohol dehydrogenase family)